MEKIQKSSIFLLLYFVIFLVLFIYLEKSDSIKAQPNSAIQSIVNEISSDSLYNYTKNLEDISRIYGDTLYVGNDTFWVNNTRFSPSHECSLAADYIYSYFADTLGFSNHITGTDTSYVLFRHVHPDYIPEEFLPDSCGWDSALSTSNWQNVVAVIKDTTAYDSCYYVTAHYDSRVGYNTCLESCFTSAPGAHDNAVGVARAMEMGRIIRNHISSDLALKYSICFAFWTGHEQGWIGSASYVDSLTDTEAELIKGLHHVGGFGFCCTCKDSARDVSIRLHRKDSTYSFPYDLANIFIDCGTKYAHLDSFCILEAASAGDDQPFVNRNPLIKAMRGTNYSIESVYGRSCPYYPRGHTVNDTTDNLDSLFVTEFVKMDLAALLALTIPDTLPDVGVGITGIGADSTAVDFLGSYPVNPEIGQDGTLYFRLDVVNHCDQADTGDMWTVVVDLSDSNYTVSKVFTDHILSAHGRDYLFRKEDPDNSNHNMPDSTGDYKYYVKVGAINVSTKEEIEVVDYDYLSFSVVE
jgi:hypothetical protein